MPKVGVILCGCGVFDGSEIHEATLALLALTQKRADIVCLAPDVLQRKVTDHAAQKDTQEKRNCFTEAARIARGNIKKISDVKAKDFDAFVIPGGFGAALNLSDFALSGAQIKIEPTLKNLLIDAANQRKPMAAFCIAPPIFAAIMKDIGIRGARLTVGNDKNVASAIMALGAEHEPCLATDCVVDEANRLVTTPAYMLATDIAELWIGIEKAIDELMKMMK